MAELNDLLDNATTLIDDKKYDGAIDVLKSIIDKEADLTSEEVLKSKEKAILQLGKIYVEQKQSDELAGLLKSLKPFFDKIPKAKTDKLVGSLITLLTQIPGADHLVIDLCKENIEWTNTEKRTLLRHRLEGKLAAAYFKIKDYQSALTLISTLLREVKRLDDKPLLVELHLLESKIHHGLGHLPKARAALTAARTSANVVYCPPLLQAELDILSGTLHCDEKDYKTAYSYFYEAFENYTQMDDDRGILCLKYMLLCKIMINLPEDVQNLVSGKLALRYAGSELEAMRAVASAHTNSSLKQFQAAIETYKQELREDPLIHRHLNELYDTLLEQNLLRIIETFSEVQISHVADLIELPAPSVEKKLSQMILDKKLSGILDQGNNCLIVFDEPETDGTYQTSLETVTHIGKVVDSLYRRASKLS